MQRKVLDELEAFGLIYRRAVCARLSLHEPTRLLPRYSLEPRTRQEASTLNSIRRAYQLHFVREHKLPVGMGR
jgi:hypothetical protein